MAKVEVDGQDVVVRLSPLEKVGAVRGDVRVPHDAIRTVAATDQPFTQLRGLRAPGTGWPRRIALGTWRRRGGKDFYAVYRDKRALVIELDGAKAGLDRLVVSVDSPEDVKKALSVL